MLNDESIFYHYCSVDAFVNILKTNSIWLTHARELNDFQEDIFFRNLFKEQGSVLKTEVSQKNNLFNKL